MSVDFYNHDSKESDCVNGFDPIYNTLFSFKNTVDDFYVKFLENDFVAVDLIIIIGSKKLKLGTAKLPLNKLIENDFSF